MTPRTHTLHDSVQWYETISSANPTASNDLSHYVTLSPAAPLLPPLPPPLAPSPAPAASEEAPRSLLSALMFAADAAASYLEWGESEILDEIGDGIGDAAEVVAEAAGWDNLYEGLYA